MRKGFLTSFIQNWNLFDYFVLRLKQFIYFIMIFLSYYMKIWQGINITSNKKFRYV